MSSCDCGSAIYDGGPSIACEVLAPSSDAFLLSGEVTADGVSIFSSLGIFSESREGTLVLSSGKAEGDGGEVEGMLRGVEFALWQMRAADNCN